MTAHTNGPRVLDLFCGAGGFSLGFERAGYEVLAGVDYDDDALETYNENYGHPGIKCNLSEVDPEEFFEEYADFNAADVDVIVGGPPCQSFSLAGNRDPDDERGELFYAYIDFIDYVSPVSFMAENVPGILSMQDGKVIEEITDRLERCGQGYEVTYRKLNAAAHGVPQSRKRVFITGLRAREYEYPEPTHVVF